MPDSQKFSTFYMAPDDIEARMSALRVERGLAHSAVISYPCAADLDATGNVVPWTLIATAIRGKANTEAIYQPTPSSLVFLSAGHGQLQVRTFAKTPLEALRLRDEIMRHIPREDQTPEEGRIAVTFWANTDNGPRGFRREMDADAWADIDANYSAGTRPRLARMMSGFEPGRGGQLLLWHGDPGTGKTTALRCLAREWRGWCDMHYITDPDRFFGSDSAYLLKVLLNDEDETVFESDLVDTEAPLPRWRLLVLEDCGEMLTPDARAQTGQGLSRLLNACDGLIGRGLRIMVLITTNEQVSKLHEAVSRPGRCAVNIDFERFTALDAGSWLAERGIDCPHPTKPQTLADLYARAEGLRVVDADRAAVGFG